MGFGINTKVGKTIAANAPKHSRIVEPFGDGGSYAFFMERKRAREHVLGIEDESLFAILSFIQLLSSADKARLKSFDWIGSEETFDKVLGITATEGAEFFYRYFYLMEFGVMARGMSEDAAPMFDWLRRGMDMKKSSLFDLPLMKIALKGVALVLGDSMALVQSGGSDTFLILLPGSPEQVQAVEGKLSGLSSPFFFAKKSASNDDLAAAVASNAGQIVVSSFAAASIMMAQMEVRTNYENKLPLLEPEPGKGTPAPM